MLRTLIILAFLLPSGCMVGPDFKKPVEHVANHYILNHTTVKEKPVKYAYWWTAFHDQKLTDLINLGYQNNLTLEIAGVHVLQERAELAQSVGNLYPQQQGIAGNYTYQRIGGGMLQDLLPSSFLTAQFGFSSTWEIDFWGKYRRIIQSKASHFYSSLAAYDNALVTLTADIASTYISLRTSETQIKVTKANIKVQTESLAIAKARFVAGETSLLDVQQATTELDATTAKLPPLMANAQREKDLLAVLLGMTPPEIDPLVNGQVGIPKAPATIAVAIPRDTLRQRPDIYQAMLEAAAESAATGAVKANLYPAFSLAGTFAFASNNIGTDEINDIFHWSNRVISAGPSMAMPLLNYGQITNAVRAQDAVFQQALLKYLNLVLKAQQEVQDNISNYIQAQKAVHFLSAASTSALITVKLALIRYKEGESDYTIVLDAEQQLLQVQLSLTSAQGDISQALVALYRALGGGWQIRNGNDIVPNHTKAAMAARTNWGNLLEHPNHVAPANKSQLLKQYYLPNW